MIFIMMKKLIYRILLIWFIFTLSCADNSISEPTNTAEFPVDYMAIKAKWLGLFTDDYNRTLEYVYTIEDSYITCSSTLYLNEENYTNKYPEYREVWYAYIVSLVNDIENSVLKITLLNTKSQLFLRQEASVELVEFPLLLTNNINPLTYRRLFVEKEYIRGIISWIEAGTKINIAFNKPDLKLHTDLCLDENSENCTFPTNFDVPLTPQEFGISY